MAALDRAPGAGAQAQVLAGRRCTQLPARRAALIEARTAARNRAERVGLALRRAPGRAAGSRRSSATSRGGCRHRGAMLRATTASPQRRGFLSSIPSVSDVSATAILVWMPEIGTLEPGAVASLAGLAPFTRQSGRWKGAAKIGGGAPSCAARSTCPPSPPPASTPTSRRSTTRPPRRRQARQGRAGRGHAETPRPRRTPSIRDDREWSPNAA